MVIEQDTVIPWSCLLYKVIPNMLNQSIPTLNLPPHLMSQARKFFADKVHLSDGEADNP